MADPHPLPATLSKQMLIGGQWRPAVSGRTIVVENPGRREPLGDIPRGEKADVDLAVAAAERRSRLEGVVPRERGQLLLKIAEAMEARVRKRWRAPSPSRPATRCGRRRGARPSWRPTSFATSAGWLGAEGRDRPARRGRAQSYTRREPIGIVGAIIPWNAPVMLGALKIAPALCAGNALVMKAPRRAARGAADGRDLQRFLPPGVLNVITGYGEECGGPARHPSAGPQAVASPARPRSARLIMRAAAERIVPVSLELGGKSPSIVYPDCRRGLGGRRHHQRHALHPPEPVAARRARACSCTRTSSTASWRS